MRFPDALKSEATAYADQLGISLNALCSIALRDYLDARKQSAAKPTPPAVAKQPAAATVQASPGPPLRAAEMSGEVKVPLGDAMRTALPPQKRKSKNRRKR
jgi:hypothetical protein